MTTQPVPGDSSWLIAAMPFAASLGIELDAAAADEVLARMEWAGDRCTVGACCTAGR